MNRLTLRREDGSVTIRAFANELLKMGVAYTSYNFLEFTKCVDEINKKKGSVVSDLLNKLADYEDAEEQGRIVKLPCKVGNTVYSILGTDILNFLIKEIRLIGVNEVDYIADNEVETLYHGFTFGKNLFLTREDAEKKLKSMRSEQ